MEVSVRDNALQMRLNGFLHCRTDTEPGKSSSPVTRTNGRSSPSTTAACPGPASRSGSPAMGRTPTGCPTRRCAPASSCSTSRSQRVQAAAVRQAWSSGQGRIGSTPGARPTQWPSGAPRRLLTGRADGSHRRRCPRPGTRHRQVSRPPQGGSIDDPSPHEGPAQWRLSIKCRHGSQQGRSPSSSVNNGGKLLVIERTGGRAPSAEGALLQRPTLRHGSSQPTLRADGLDVVC